MDLDFYLISVLVFIAILAVLVYRDRSKFKRESILLLRRTQRGKKFLIKIGTTFPRFWKVVGFVSVITGFVASVIGVKFIFDMLIMNLTAETAGPGLALVIPSLTATPVFGYGFLAVPFWYYIISIALLVIVHEGFHGIFTARERTKIKSLGVGLLAIIPLAFVEPDEEQLAKKSTWAQLRVFSAGSFANFLLAGLSLLIFVWMINAFYTPAGVNFQTYPYEQISVASIQKVNEVGVVGVADINATLGNFPENETIMITTADDVFYIQNALLMEQLAPGLGEVLLFQNYPAVRVGLDPDSVIVAVDGYEVNDHVDLTLALEEAGEGKLIEITTKKGDMIEKVSLVTAEAPRDDVYVPDSMLYIFAPLEHLIPGSIDFYQGSAEWIAGNLGVRTDVTWNSIRQKILMWNWISENYPGLEFTAKINTDKWEKMLQERNRPGFIGIVGVLPAQYEIKPEFAYYEDAGEFAQGLLFFLFLINLGVGIFNLLPIKPFDGGKMWDIVLAKYMPRHSRWIMRLVMYVILALLIANFLPLGNLV
ncbi:MAG: site-2 protease family protein [Candidatus Aenigmatarchaeota archaeon]|nr:MAG: site-2 protease family protein [Candidatus Aenigmarchaeota archaeon]